MKLSEVDLNKLLAASPKEKNILIPKEIKLFEGYVFHYEYWVGLPKEV